MNVWFRFEEEARAKGARVSYSDVARSVYFPGDVSWHVTRERATGLVYVTEVSLGTSRMRSAWIKLDTEELWKAIRGNVEWT